MFQVVPENIGLKAKGSSGNLQCLTAEESFKDGSDRVTSKEEMWEAVLMGPGKTHILNGRHELELFGC